MDSAAPAPSGSSSSATARRTRTAAADWSDERAESVVADTAKYMRAGGLQKVLTPALTSLFFSIAAKVLSELGEPKLEASTSARPRRRCAPRNPE
eukprot:tig00000241_g21026.t1